MHVDDIERRGDEVQKLIEQLVAEMQAVPPDQRIGDAWGLDGKFRRRFVELQRRQVEIGRQLMLALEARS